MTFWKFKVGETDIQLLFDEFQRVFDKNRQPIYCKIHKSLQLQIGDTFDVPNCRACATVGREPPYLGDYT